jgi:hypothetical protein
MSTTGEGLAAPNRNDYWAQPENQELGDKAFRWLQQHESRFVASVEPLADLFLSADQVIPSGWVTLHPPGNYEQYGFKHISQATYLVLDHYVKEKSDGRYYMGHINGGSFEPYGLQGRSTTVALGDLSDSRQPSEYAQVALAMPGDYYANGAPSKWLARLPEEAITEKAAAAMREREVRANIETVQSRAAAAELKARSHLGRRLVAIAIGRLDRYEIREWDSRERDSAVRMFMGALATYGSEYSGKPRTLANISDRIDAGLVPEWGDLYIAAAAILSDLELRDIDLL